MYPQIPVKNFNNYQYLASPVSSMCPPTSSPSFKDYVKVNPRHASSLVNTLVFICKPLGLLFI